MITPLLKASYGLYSCSDAVEEGSQPVFGLPFKFGRPLTFHRDLQPQHDNTEHTPQGGSSIHKQHHSKRAAASALHVQQQQQQERGRRKARTPKATVCRCCQQGMPSLGVLASCLAQRGMSTAAAAHALAAVAASAAAFELVAAQSVCESGLQVPAPVQQHTSSNGAGLEAADAGAGAVSDQHSSASGAATAAVCAVTAAVSEGCRSSPTKASKTVRFEAVSPGPGQYTLPPAALSQGPAFTIGARPASQQHGSTKADCVPGPGTYGTACTPGGPAFSLGGRWTDAGQAPAAPGPGEHQQLAFIPGGPAFSFLRRPGATAADKEGAGSPGPGAYGPDWDNPASPSGPAWSLGIRPRGALDGGSNLQAAVPGPGAYHPDNCTYRADGPAYSFPAKSPADMSALAAAAGPGPGQYDTSTAYCHTLASAPAFSMPKARSSTAAGPEQAMQGPGPGAYFSTDPSTDPGGIGRDAPAFSMGGRQQQWQEGVQWDSPGPGEYFREAAAEGPAFSMAGRTPGAEPAGTSSTDTPGPGHYSLAGVAAGAAVGSAAAPAWTIAGRVGDAAAAAAAVKASQPGPGSYDVGVQGSQGPAYSIQGRPTASGRARDATPGPLDYCPDPSALLPSAPCYSIAGRPAASSAPAACYSPGPGDYDVTGQPGSLCREGPAWTMGSKAAAVAANGCDSPGPGAYHRPDLHPGSDGPAFTIAGKLPVAGAAAEAAGMLLPGPGQYEAAGVQAGAAFTMAARLASIVEQQVTTPGPGAYLAPDFPDPSSSSAPAFTIAGRPACPSRCLQASAAVPGPGTYQAAELPKGPAYSLPVAGRQVAEGQEAGSAEGPGPGTYEVAAGDSGAPAWTIGSKVSSSGAAGQGADATPAPGDYHPLPDLPRGPAWTLAGKPAAAWPGAASGASSSACEQPGPGHYSLPDEAGHGLAFSMAGKSSRVEGGAAAAAAAAAEPGPGAYFSPKGREGLSFTFRRKLGPSTLGAAGGDTPGPGYYHKEAPAALASTTGSSAPRLDTASAAASTAACGRTVTEPAVSQQQLQPSQVKGASVGQAPGGQAGVGRDTAAPQAVSCSKQLTLAQLNAQLAGLLKQKGSKQSRMRRYCLAA